MPLNITITHVLMVELPPGAVTLDDLNKLKELLVSQLSDAIKAANDAADAAVARVTGDLDTLTKKVADLQSQVDAGAATQADLDALAALQAKLAALDVTNPAVLPTKPPEPEPAPATN